MNNPAKKIVLSAFWYILRFSNFGILSEIHFVPLYSLICNIKQFVQHFSLFMKLHKTFFFSNNISEMKNNHAL